MFQQIAGGLMSLLGGFALALALTGLVGMLLYLVGARTREIGIRRSLGATSAQIRRMIVRQGLWPVASGVIAGVAIGAILRAAFQPFFVRFLPPMNVWSLVGVVMLFLAAGAIASDIPARRASSIDPSVALRQN
jgi:ABC-type antimicrobial peptide transport system permease subunit